MSNVDTLVGSSLGNDAKWKEKMTTKVVFMLGLEKSEEQENLSLEKKGVSVRNTLLSLQWEPAFWDAWTQNNPQIDDNASSQTSWNRLPLTSVV